VKTQRIDLEMKILVCIRGEAPHVVSRTLALNIPPRYWPELFDAVSVAARTEATRLCLEEFLGAPEMEPEA